MHKFIAIKIVSCYPSFEANCVFVIIKMPTQAIEFLITVLLFRLFVMYGNLNPITKLLETPLFLLILKLKNG